MENGIKRYEKKYIKNFKRHLSLNIASMMQGYSDQEYKFSNSRVDENNVILIDMEIFSDTGSVIVTWRLKESKGNFLLLT